MEEWEARRLYQRHHSMTLDKRAISKDQKELMEAIKEYLEENPGGFDVELEDARGKFHVYHVGEEESTRATLDKGMLQYELEKKGIKVKLADITPGFLAEMVEQGRISADLVREYEAINTSHPVKKRKVKRPLTVQQRGGAA